MIPREFKAANCFYRDPDRFSSVAMVPGFRHEETETSTTVWHPSAEELAKLNRGGAVVVVMDGEQAPIYVEALEGV